MELFKEIPIDMLRKSPTNPRRRRDPKKFEDLCASVKEKGIIQPIVVRETGDFFEIAVGEGRYLAAEKAGLEKLPAMVRQLSDLEVLEIQIIENAQREDIHPLDEGEGYKRLMAMDNYDVAAIAAKVGKSESWVYQRMKLADLIEPVKEAFVGDALTAGHAILIARLQPKDQEAALKECFEDSYLDDFRGKHGLQKIPVSVRELESWIQENIHLDLHSAPWKKDDKTLYPEAGACTTCQKRTGFMPSLFPDIAKKDTCTDPACFKKKQALFVDRKKTELIEPAPKGSPLAAKVPVEISTGYNKPDKRGVYARGKYTEIQNKADRCQFTTKAVVAHGDHDIGHVKEVCVSPECKKHPHHHPSSSRGDVNWEARQKRQREKQAETEEYRTRIFNAMAPKIPKSLAAPELRVIADELYNEAFHVLDELRGWKPKKGSGLYLPHNERSKRVQSLKPAELAPFINQVLLAREINRDYSYGNRSDYLLEAAKRYKINVKKIERDFTKELKEKKSAERKAAAAKKKAQTSAKAKEADVAAPNHNSEAAKIAHALHSGEDRDKVQLHPDGSAHMIYDEPTCIGCNCTQLSPCPEGCSWTNLEEKSKRGLCTSCNAKGIKFTRATVTRVKSNGKEQAMAAKAKKKASKKKPASKKKESAQTQAAG